MELNKLKGHETLTNSPIEIVRGNNRQKTKKWVSIKTALLPLSYPSDGNSGYKTTAIDFMQLETEQWPQEGHVRWRFYWQDNTSRQNLERLYHLTITSLLLYSLDWNNVNAESPETAPEETENLNTMWWDSPLPVSILHVFHFEGKEISLLSQRRTASYTLRPIVELPKSQTLTCSVLQVPDIGHCLI